MAETETPANISDPKLNAEYQKIWQERENVRRQKAGDAEDLNQKLDIKMGTPNIESKFPLSRAIASAPLTDAQMDAAPLTDDQMDTAPKKTAPLTDDQMDAAPKPDPSGMANYVPQLAPKADLDHVNTSVQNRVKVFQQAQPKPQEGAPQQPRTPQEVATNFYDAFNAGFGQSIDAESRTNSPGKYTLSADADWWQRTAAFAGHSLGDIRNLATGGFIGAGVVEGAAEGAPLGPWGVVGGALTGATMAGFLHSTLRQSLVDSYEKGTIKDWRDFWTRTSGSFIKSSQEGAEFAAMDLAGIGGAMIPGVGFLAGPLWKIAAMASFGSHAEKTGWIPSWKQIGDAATAIFSFHAATTAVSATTVGIEKLTSKLGQIYAKTGVHPEQVATDVKADPQVLQDVLSTNIDIPKKYEPMVDPKANETAENPKNIIEIKPTEVLPGVEDAGGQGLSVDKTAEEPPPPPKENPLDKVTEGEGTATPQEETSLDRQIVYSGEGLKKNALQKGVETFNESYRRFLDQYDPVKLFQRTLTQPGEKLKALQDPYWMSRLMNAGDQRAHEVVSGNPQDANGNPMPNVESILEPFGNDRKGFTKYHTAAVNLERMMKNPKYKSGFPIEDLQKTVEAGREKYDAASRAFSKVMNQVADYGAAHGISDPNMVSASKEKYEYYAPMHDAELGGVKGGKSSPIKGLTEGGKELGSFILDPIEQAIKKIYGTYRLSAYNDAIAPLAKLVAREGNQTTGVEHITPDGPKHVTEAELVNPESTADLVKKGQATYFENGVRKTLTLPEKVANAFIGNNSQESNLIVQALHPFTVMKRAGIVDTFQFLTRHFERAEVAAASFSKHGYIYGVGGVRGFMEQILGTQTAQDAKWNGALMGAAQSLDNKYLSNDLFKASQKSGATTAVSNVIKSPLAMAKVYLDKMHDLAGMVANAPRVEEYRLAMKGKERTLENMTEAAKAAREVLPDSSRMGADLAVRGMSRITAFANLRVQGNVMLAEKLSNPETALPVFAKALALNSIPAAYLWYANKDDKDANDVNPTVQDLNNIIVSHDWQSISGQKSDELDALEKIRPDLFRVNSQTGAKEFDQKVLYKISRSFEEGILFGALVHRVLDAAWHEKDPETNEYKHRHAMDGFFHTMAEAAAFGAVPDGILPLAEQYGGSAGRVQLTQTPIIPHHLEDLLPHAQYTEYTSETAKQIGSVLEKIPAIGDIGPANAKLASPMILDNYIREYGGNMGQFVTQMLDQLASQAKPGAAPTVKNTAYIGSFVSNYLSMQSKAIQDFETESRHNDKVIKTWQFLLQHRDLARGFSDLEDSLLGGHMTSLAGMRDVIGKIQKDLHTITQLPDSGPGGMPPNDKRRLYDTLEHTCIYIAKQGNMIFDKLNRTDLSAQVEAMKTQVDQSLAKEKLRAGALGLVPQPSPQQDQQAPPAPQQQQAPAPAPQQIRHVRPAPQRQAPIPGTDSNWQNPALAPTHPSKAGGE